MDRIRHPSCSLIIATYNWPEALEKCLQSVFAQTDLPAEIIIADDGSDSRTERLLEEMKKNSPIPIFHLWHEDKGFRLSEIRNKAIAAARFDYIIQIDGDIIIDQYFIQDHLRMTERGSFLCGSRVLLSEKLTVNLLKNNSGIKKHTLPLGYLLNSIRIPLLSNFLADRYKRTQLTSLRGCNMSFWKADLLAVNGYNNDINGWGSEDAELAARLINNNVRKRFIKFSAVAYHLFHRINSKANLDKNKQILQMSLDKKITSIPNGIKNLRNSE